MFTGLVVEKGVIESDWMDASHTKWFNSMFDKFLGCIQRGDVLNDEIRESYACVEVIEKDLEGIHALRFVFARPLDDPSYRFFVGSPWRTAQPWRPGGWPPVPRVEPRLAVVQGRMQRVQIALDCVTRLLSRLP